MTAWSPGVMGAGLSAGGPPILQWDSGHSVAGELGFSLLLPMLLYLRTAFLLHSQNKSCLLFAYVLSLSLFDKVASLKVCTKPLGQGWVVVFPSRKLPLLPHLGHSLLVHRRSCCFPLPPPSGHSQRGVSLTCRSGQTLLCLWTSPLGSRSLLSLALPPAHILEVISLCPLD